MIQPTSGGTAAVGDSPVAASPDYALHLEGLDKTFGGTHALDAASLRVRRGTVHALLGGNGSGKSTAIKILAGVHPADAGALTIFGRNYPLASYLPATAQVAGLRFVHQDLGMFDELSIEENFALDAGYPVARSGRIEWRQLRRRVATLLQEYELDVDPRLPVKDLRQSDRTMLAIARALQDQEDSGELILVLDEPTASLAAHESALLLDKVRRRADKGQTVVIVSHRLQEVLTIADDFTIFRDGKVAAELVAATPSEDELIEIMAGRTVTPLGAGGAVDPHDGTAVLEVESLVAGPLRGVDLTLHRGEIVGIAGLVGSGRSTLLKSIFGAVEPSAGALTLRGVPFAPSHIDEAMDAGIAMVPEDRARDAAFADLTISENLAVSLLRENWVSRWMPRGKERRAARELLARFRVKAAGPDALFSSMSGGNQQKVIIARWLQREPSLLLLDEPTQGVDVMSRSDIYAIIRDAAAGGCSVLVASSDVSELHALCHSIVFLRGGVIADRVPVGELDVDALTRLMLKDLPLTSANPVEGDKTA